MGGDNELDVDEFLAFRHPEIAGNSYKHIVDDLILQMGMLFSIFNKLNLFCRSK
jgi:hypothetical protein